MDNQNPYQNQNLKQAQGHASGYKYTIEVKQDESAQIQKGGQSAFKSAAPITKGQSTSQIIEQKKVDGGEKTQKPKRPRKTIEQELAELDAKRQKLIEKKRSQDTHKKIVFGATVITMLKDMKKRNDKNGDVICKAIEEFITEEQSKNDENIKIIKEIISQI